MKVIDCLETELRFYFEVLSGDDQYPIRYSKDLNEWVCGCAVKHNRKIGSNCKHIELCKDYIKNRKC